MIVVEKLRDVTALDVKRLASDMSIAIAQLRNWLAGLFLFLLPWQTRWIIRPAEIGGVPWEYGTLAFYATEILLWIIILLGWKDIIRGSARLGTWKWAGAALLALAFLSVAWSPAPFVTFFAALHLLEASLLIFILKILSPESFKMFAMMFLLGVAVQASLGVTQVASQWVHPSTLFGIALHDPMVAGTSVIETATGRFLRAYGGLPHPNVLGGYLMTAVFFVIALAHEVKNRASWFVILAGSAVLTSALFLTFSRSAWIAVAVGVLCVVFLMLRPGRGNLFEPVLRFRIASLVLVVITILAVCGFAFSDVLTARFSGSGRLESISLVERSRGISDALVLVKDHPLVGSGIGASTLALAKKWPGSRAWAYQPMHNVFILIVVELGIIGVIVVFMIVIGLWQIFSRWWMKGVPEDRLRAAALFGAATGILAITLFDHYPWSLYSGNMLVAVTIGFLLNQAKDTL